MNSVYSDKMHMLYNHNKSCLKSCKKTLLFFKNPLFSKKSHCFPTCALFYPIVLKRKIITGWHTLRSMKLHMVYIVSYIICFVIKKGNIIYVIFDTKCLAARAHVCARNTCMRAFVAVCVFAPCYSVCTIIT